MFKELKQPKISLGLERVRKVLDLLGNPQNTFPSVIVAGTNGKGSTVAMLEAILRGHEYQSVGMYTSPHLINYTERIQINRKLISPQKLSALLRKVKKISVDLALTEFELLTVAAFMYFAEHQVTIAVLEVGLGGRLDATNVVTPLLSVITDISLDHTDYLGNTLDKIAGEKAGIIKPRVPCITSNTDRVIIKVLEGKARELNTTCKIIKLTNQEGKTSLVGAHQQRNRILAVASAQFLLGKQFKQAKAERALKQVEWPGRFQIIRQEPLTIIDGAHNPAGANALHHVLHEQYPKRRPIFIIGILPRKEKQGIIEALYRSDGYYLFTPIRQNTSCEPVELAKFLPGHATTYNCNNLATADKIAKHIYKPSRNVIVITGSLYLVGEAMKYFGSVNPIKPGI